MIVQFAKRPQQAQIKQRLQRTAALFRRMIFSRLLPGLLPGLHGASHEIRRKAERVGDLHQAAGRGLRGVALRRRLLDRGAEHFGEIALRKPDGKPSCFHKLINVPVRRVAHCASLCLYDPKTSQPTFDRGSFMNPANKFTSGSPL